MSIFYRMKMGLCVFSIIGAGVLLASCGEESVQESSLKPMNQTLHAPLNESMSEPMQEPANQAQPATLGTPIASIPDKDIYLYGKDPEGVVLQAGDRVQDFDWQYMTPRMIQPVLDVYDYDGDGKEELSAVLYVGSGTGISIEELHIVEISEDTMEDQPFSDYQEQIDKSIRFRTYTQSEEMFGEITIGTDAYPFSLKDYQNTEYDRIGEKLLFGNIVGFYTENHVLKAKFAVGIAPENFVSPEFIGDLHADVVYHSGTFTLTHFKFQLN